MSHDFSFLLCTERSGSNFITSLLNGHPEVCGPSPTHLFRLFATNLHRYGDLRQDRNWETFVADLVLNFRCKLGIWKTDVSEKEIMENVNERSAVAALAHIYRNEAAADGARHIFISKNYTYLFAPFLLAGFPKARFVHLVRDPRDVASSWVATAAMPGGTKNAVDVWHHDQTETLALTRQLSDSGRVLTVRYEDLVTNSEPTVERLVRFLGLEPHPDVFDFHKDQRVQDNAGAIAAWENLKKPILSDNTGKFDKALGKDDVLYIETRCGELMAEFGYARTTSGADESDASRKETIARLEPKLNPGDQAKKASPREREEDVRARRLAAIQRVLSRDLQAAS